MVSDAGKTFGCPKFVLFIRIGMPKAANIHTGFKNSPTVAKHARAKNGKA
jgi:hypothetical protein